MSVTLGAPAGGTPSVSTPVVTSNPPPVAPALVAGGSSDEPEDADFEAAKKIFEEARSRPYYDATEDAADRTAYYSGISATLNPSQLYDALSELVRSTHTKELGYKPSLHLYPWVDLQPESKNPQQSTRPQMFEPLEFIARDLEVARLRRERLTSFPSVGSSRKPSYGSGIPGIAGSRTSLQLRACRASVLVPKTSTDARRSPSLVRLRVEVQQLPQQYSIFRFHKLWRSDPI